MHSTTSCHLSAPARGNQFAGIKREGIGSLDIKAIRNNRHIELHPILSHLISKIHSSHDLMNFPSYIVEEGCD